MMQEENILFIERLSNIEDKLAAYDIQIDEFVKNADISSAQWLEERFRALEHEAKIFRELLGSGILVDMNKEIEMIWMHLENVQAAIENLWNKNNEAR